MPLPTDLSLVVGIDLAYARGSNPRKCRILPTGNPANGFTFVRWNPSLGETFATGKRGRVSGNFVQAVCNALVAGNPVHADTELHAGGNGRSVLEAALASTPNCWMRRVGGRKMVTYDTTQTHPTGQICYS